MNKRPQPLCGGRRISFIDLAPATKEQFQELEEILTLMDTIEYYQMQSKETKSTGPAEVIKLVVPSGTNLKLGGAIVITDEDIEVSCVMNNLSLHIGKPTIKSTYPLVSSYPNIR